MVDALFLHHFIAFLGINAKVSNEKKWPTPTCPDQRARVPLGTPKREPGPRGSGCTPDFVVSEGSCILGLGIDDKNVGQILGQALVF